MPDLVTVTCSSCREQRHGERVFVCPDCAGGGRERQLETSQVDLRVHEDSPLADRFAEIDEALEQERA